MQKRCCRLAWTEEKKLVTDTNRPAKRWLGALSAAPRSGEISPKNYRPCPEYQSRHHCDENERPAPSACRARGAASGRWRRASNPVLSHILSRPAFATNTARSPSGGHGGGVHVCGIEIPYRLTVYGMSGIVQVFGRRQWRALDALGRPASEKRQGTKSREVEAPSVP